VKLKGVVFQKGICFEKRSVLKREKEANLRWGIVFLKIKII
jgi:hypothetical protein